MCDNDESDGRERSEHLKIGLLLALATWGGFVVLAAAVWILSDHKDSEIIGRLGQFGDSFGAINALFSSVAVAGAVYAVILQQQELKLTRQEMRQARLAHQDSAASQGRMAAIQGSTALLDDLSREIQYLRKKREEHRSLALRVADLIRNYPTAFNNQNLDSGLQSAAKALFREAEGIGLWEVKSYNPASIHFQAAIDMLALRSRLEAAIAALDTTISDLLRRKTEITGSLDTYIKAETSVPHNSD